MCGEITAHLRAVALGDFTSLATALGVAEQRRVSLQAELTKLDGHSRPRSSSLRPLRSHMGSRD
jgi:hypothetical protein